MGRSLTWDELVSLGLTENRDLLDVEDINSKWVSDKVRKLSEDVYARILETDCRKLPERIEAVTIASEFLRTCLIQPALKISQVHTSELSNVCEGVFTKFWRNTVARARIALWVLRGGTITKCPDGPVWEGYWMKNKLGEWELR